MAAKKPMSKAARKKREERLKKICGQINKGTHGGASSTALTWLGSSDCESVRRWTSGCPDIDDALGGGWPKGRWIELFGPESGGKSTTCLHAIAEHQKEYPDEDIALIDSEYTFDEEYAQQIGVDTDFIMVHQPESGEQALNVIEQLIQNGVTMIIVDSVAALVPKSELEGEVGAMGVGTQARMMSVSLRRLIGEASRADCTIFWTNQVRDKIGVSYGSPETTPAGRALKHYASIRARISKIGNVKEGEVIVSAKTRADIKKNKVAPPFRRAEFNITFGIGIDSVASIMDKATVEKIIVQRGSWFSMDGVQIGQGRKAVLEMLRGDDELVEKLKDRLEALKNPNDATEENAEVKAETEKEDKEDAKADAAVVVTDV